ncbi:MAG: hypothetical protein K2N36_02820, partial [Ruminiclostridium sp.]|nr:hypothetical protein [Ruminiclostridium sp.]
MTAENANDLQDTQDLQTVMTVSAAVDKCLYPFDFLYDYYIPLSLEGKISAGQTVLVPFGKSNQARVAMVYGV